MLANNTFTKLPKMEMADESDTVPQTNCIKLEPSTSSDDFVGEEKSSSKPKLFSAQPLFEDASTKLSKVKMADESDPVSRTFYIKLESSTSSDDLVGAEMNSFKSEFVSAYPSMKDAAGVDLFYDEKVINIKSIKEEENATDWSDTAGMRYQSSPFNEKSRCELCGAEFAQAGSLMVHMSVYHGQDRQTLPPQESSVVGETGTDRKHRNHDGLMEATKKRKYLTLEDRVNVVNRHEKGETAIAIAKSFKVGKTQIQRIIRDKDDILKRWESGDDARRMRSKRQKTIYSEVNEKVWDWFLDARRKNVPITGKLIQDKAIMLSVELGHDDFAASNGWLDRWLKRNNVKMACLSGDRAKGNEEVVEDWKKRLPTLCDGYEPCDIFNADESGFFYRAMPNECMVQKGDDRAGVKTSKDRVTVLFTVSAVGEKLKPLLIGKSAKPQCFMGQDVNCLGVDYFHNKHAWMTSAIFTQWANKLNNKMRLQKRKILVFIDNCSAHPLLSLSNVQFKFLPPNTTAKLQSCDAGVVQTVKLHYREQLLRHLLFEMEEDKTATGPELAKKISLLDAILWVKKAWSSLKPETIQKCFIKCGFPVGRGDSDLSAAQDAGEFTEQLDAGEHRLLGDMIYEEYVSMDDNIQAAADLELDTPSNSQAAMDQDVTLEPNEDNKEEEAQEETIDFKTASLYAHKLTTFALKHAPELVDTIQSFKSDIEAIRLKKLSSATQPSLFTFFKKL